jgi:hypothetical protein
MRGLVESLSRLPIVQRCVVIGWVSTGTLAAVVTVINVIGEYSSGGVIRAALFGMVEAFVLVGFVGGCIGLFAGLLARHAQNQQRR